jgi:hypothetical protein
MLSRAAKVKLGPEHSLSTSGFSRTTLLNRRWSTFTTPSIDRPHSQSLRFTSRKKTVGVEHIGIMTSSEGGSCQLAPGSPDVVAMLIDANTFEWFKYRYNLKDSQVMKNTFACVCASQSMGMEVKHDFQYDSRLIMPFFTMLSPRPSKRSATRERDAKTRCNGCQKVYYCCRECQKADWKQHKTTCGHVFTVVNCSDYRAWSASRT